MFGNLGTEQDAGVSSVAMRGAVEPFNLGNRKEVFEAVERDIQEYVLQNAESNIGYCMDD